ncbi:MAG TPA: hypothetical protein VLW54_07545 [Candidatus Acidoferrales bacterium]|nr:hypothetical protein [Candidatus Acidoferrales bacterium]
MRRLPLLLALCTALCGARPAFAQLPFYTDDPAVTPPRVLHFEFFNEFDGLHSSDFPDQRQNTANFKFQYGLPHGLELDLDFPYLSIYRAPGNPSAGGFGDTELGVKWNFHQPSVDSRVPGLAAALYVEFPTGSTRQQLGSGLTDYWMYLSAQEPLSAKSRVNLNFGYLFAGNTSTGVVGIRTARGHVFTGGLSFLHDFTSRWTLGTEVYWGVADRDVLGRTQLQFMGGGQYAIRSGWAFTFGLLGGKFEASPRIGAQIGFALDFPDVVKRRKHR